MDITNINLGACPPQYLAIGYRDEYGARPVAFDFSAWAAEYGAGVLQLLLQRPGEKEPFPVLLDIDGTTATWTPDEVATKNEGQGRAQLLYTRDGLQVRDAVFTVLIAPSLGAAGDPPEPYEDWLQRLTALAAETQQSAIDAAGSAEAAGTSAGAAAGSAGAAAQSALDAEAAKTGAEAAEQTAQQAATLARAKAAEAAQSAQTAAQKATDAQQSTEDAQAASTAARLAADAARTFADDAEASKTAAALSASGAAQAKTDAQSAAAAAAAAVTEVETKGAEQITAINQAGSTQITAVDAAGAAQMQAVEDKGEEIIESLPNFQAQLDKKAPAIIETVGPAAIASFDDGAENMPLKTLKVDIPVTQSGSGDPSPENVRPISGWTGAEIYGTSENIFGGMLLRDGIKAAMPTATVDEDENTITFNAAATAAQSITTESGLSNKFKENTQYTFLMTFVKTSGNALSNLRVYYTDGSYTTIASLNNAAIKQTTVTVSTAGKTVSNLRKTNASGNTKVYYEESGIFEGVRSADDFAAYTGNQISINWQDDAGTVYGGTLTSNADGSAELAALPHYASYNGETLVGPWVSSMDVYAEGATPTTGAEVVDLGGVATVYQLTAEQIRTLAGVNNLWSDAGTVAAVYPVDTKAYVDGQTAALSGEIETLGGEVDALEGDVADLSALPIISPPDVETLVEDGEYTDEAKIALQKALGIYEAPWEIIKADTVANETSADIVITTDADGQAFELTDAIIRLLIPTQDNETVIGDYGRVYFASGQENIGVSFLISSSSQIFPANSGIRIAFCICRREKNFRTLSYAEWTGNNNHQTIKITATNNDYLSAPFLLTDSPITSITIKQITGTMSYKLYGRRKWQ